MLTQSFISLSVHSDKIEPDLELTATPNVSIQLSSRSRLCLHHQDSVMTTLLFLGGHKVISEP
jgi:hypothetical protein